MPHNPELSTMLSTLFCWAFFIILIICGIAGYLNRNTKPLELPSLLHEIKNDNVRIGYIDDRPEVNLNDLKKEVQYLKLKKQLAELQRESQIDSLTKTNAETNSIDEKLFNDCVKALMALGENKKSAKKVTFDYFTKNPNIKTVEEFVLGVYKK